MRTTICATLGLAAAVGAAPALVRSGAGQPNLVVLLTDAYIEANAQGGLGRQRVVCVEACV